MRRGCGEPRSGLTRGLPCEPCQCVSPPSIGLIEPARDDELVRDMTLEGSGRRDASSPARVERSS
jgi:hypothetical protein